jgi:hypothetical protein
VRRSILGDLQGPVGLVEEGVVVHDGDLITLHCRRHSRNSSESIYEVPKLSK